MPIVAREDCGPRSLLDEAWDILQPVACWLGQAGFLIRARVTSELVIDPYLSDSLAEKYRGSRFPHACAGCHRPLDPKNCLRWTSSFARMLIPTTWIPARWACWPASIPNAGSCFPGQPWPRPNRGEFRRADDCRRRRRKRPAGAGYSLARLASAHEELKVDAAGNPLYLGYILELGATVYHSGDCVPYPGLAAELRRQAVDVAILPVNGRDADRSAAGILGNFTFDEAIQLCREAEIGSMLACHFGMFDFNTVSERWLDERIVALVQPPQCVRPRIGTGYELWPSRPKLGEESTLYSQGITP